MIRTYRFAPAAVRICLVIASFFQRSQVEKVLSAMVELRLSQ